MFGVGLTGFLTGFSLILAIGSQNAFILRQGLARSHVFALCLFCAASDAVLITLGVLGFGAIVELYPSFPIYMAWAGAAFLLWYGLTRFWAAYLNQYDIAEGLQASTLVQAVTIAAAFTWLNPHVYLDTVVLLGGISTSKEIVDHKLAFWAGAVTASFTFFFSLGYGARLLAPIMKSAKAWRILDVGIGVLMLALALKLIL